MINYEERRPKAPTRIDPVKATCDICGDDATRPDVMAPIKIAGKIEALKRPDFQGNVPEITWVADLCHDCADAVGDFLVERASALNYPAGGPRAPDEYGN